MEDRGGEIETLERGLVAGIVAFTSEFVVDRVRVVSIVVPACVTVELLGTDTTDVLVDPADTVVAEDTFEAISEGLLFEKLPEEGATDE
jgi:hypothetical protein